MEVKTIVSSKVEEALTSWFQSGVTYTKSSIWYDCFEIPEYDNQPNEVENALLDGQMKMIYDILKRKEIPIAAWMGCIHDSPINPKRIPLSDSPLCFGFGVCFVPIPVKPLYETEGMPPQERAQEITKVWYNLTEELWTKFIAQTSIESTRPMSGLRLDKQIIEESRLQKAGWSNEDLLIRYAHLEGFTSREVADFLSRYHHKPITPSQIRTRRSRLREREQRYL